MPLLAVAALAAITYAFRLAGPLFRHRVSVSPAAERLLAAVAAVLLLALAATSALTQDGGFAGWARPVGVLTAGILAARRAPFPVVVIAAATVTALLRLGGIHLSRTKPWRLTADASVLRWFAYGKAYRHAGRLIPRSPEPDPMIGGSAPVTPLPITQSSN